MLIQGIGDNRVRQNTVFLLKHDYTNNSTNIYDATGRNTITLSGDTKVSTGVTLFGQPTIYQDGTGDLITTSLSADFDLGTSDWSVGTWFRWNNFTGYPVLWIIGSQNGVVANTHGLFGGNSTGKIHYLIGGSGAVGFNGTITCTTGVWRWVLLARQSGTTRLYVDGVLDGSTTNGPGISGNQRLYTYNGQSNYFNGNISDLIVTKGFCLPASFIPFMPIQKY